MSPSGQPTHTALSRGAEPPSPPVRPRLAPGLSEAELLRWYWLKDELQAFARDLGVSPGGSKTLLTERIGARLAGRDLPPPPPARPRPSARLSGSLDERTPIPANHPCSEELRAWFADRLGPRFAFDAPMRAFLAASDGTVTLGDAVAHWYATRDPGTSEIEQQFELNRFTRRWWQDHPGGTRAELGAAWAEYRARPVEDRGRA